MSDGVNLKGANWSLDFDLSKLEAALDTKCKEVADVIYTATQQACPVDTGLLKSTGRVAQEEEGQYTVEYGGIDNCDYAAYTEYKPGTSCTGWFSGALEHSKNVIDTTWTRTGGN